MPFEFFPKEEEYVSKEEVDKATLQRIHAREIGSAALFSLNEL